MGNKTQPPMADTTENYDPKSGSMLKIFALGSLSSSCCVMQLILNALSYHGILNLGFGCAGFNTILGPLRPVTRSITFVWLIWNWWSQSSPSQSSRSQTVSVSACCGGKKKPRRPIFETVMCLALMFSPEILTFYGNRTNNIDLMFWTTKQIETADNNDRENKSFVRLDYVVDNMGCEACINAVETLIRERKGVLKTSIVSFETGEVEIFVDEEGWDGPKRKYFEEDLDSALQEHGYELHQKGWATKKMNMNMKMNDNMFSVGDL